MPGRAWSACELSLGVLEFAGDGAIDDVVADLDPDPAHDLRILHDQQMDRRVVLRTQGLRQGIGLFMDAGG